MAVEADGVPIDEDRFQGRQGRLVFAYLVVAQGRPVPREELAEAVWGEAPPATWEKGLTVIVSRLRGLLTDCGLDGPKSLTSAFGCYRLELPEGSWVDVLAAASDLEQAQRALAEGKLGRAQTRAAEAASLARRGFLPGEEGAWVDDRRRDLAEILPGALRCLGDVALRSGEPAKAVTFAEEVVQLEPFRESGYRRLMEANAAAGNRAEALRVYERCRRLLAEELGAYPSPETESIYRGLLQAPTPQPTAQPVEAPAAPTLEQDPALGAPTGPRRPAGPTHALASRRNRWLLAGLGLALLAAAGVAAAVVSRGGGTDSVVVPPNSVAAIDPASNDVVEAIGVDEGPGPVAAGTDGLWVLNRTSRTLSRIDPRARRLLDTAGLGAFVDNLAVAGREVWVADCTLTDSLVRLDPRTRAPAWYGAVRLDLPSSGVEGGRIVSFPGCGLAAYGRSAWATNNLMPGLMRVDLGPPDADGTARAETALVVDLAPASTAPGVPVIPTAIAVGLGSVWAAVSSGDLVRQIDPESGDVLRVISVGRSPVAVTAGADAVWVANRGDDSVSRIDPRTSSVRQVISVGDQPVGLAVGEGAVWVANSGDGTVSRIDPATNKVVETIEIGHSPQGVAVTDGLVWVTVRS